MSSLAAFGTSDLRSIRRDPLLRYMALLPLLLVIGLRLVVPLATEVLATRYGFDLVSYYPLLLSIQIIIEAPFMVGIVFGLLLLDERDADTLVALQVTPVGLSGYLAYRMGAAVALSVASILISLPLSGIAPTSLLHASALTGLVGVALVASLLAPAVALFLFGFARNKLEGLALMKGLGLLIMAPMAAYFLPRWSFIAGLAPTLWPARAFWQLSAGRPGGLDILIGALYLLAVTGWLARRARQRLNEGA